MYTRALFAGSGDTDLQTWQGEWLASVNKRGTSMPETKTKILNYTQHHIKAIKLLASKSANGRNDAACVMRHATAAGTGQHR
jgi:hypothetical protein